MMIIRNIILLCTIATFAQCQSSNKTAQNDKLNPNFAYRVNEPSQTFTMPSTLQEISGLSLAEDGNLLTLNDEQGKIFKINATNGAVINETIFRAEGGDFEGIELVGNTVYAVSSKGSIYIINDYGSSATPRVEKFTNDLLRNSDVEGLGYDPKSNQLLLTCKAARSDANSRELYSFQTNTKTYGQKPILTISLAQIQNWLKKNNADKEIFKDYLADTVSEFHFGASGFAVHPTTGEYYFLSSPGKTLLVTTPDGTIKFFLKLDKKIHPQPEGICFSRDGKIMYISNEGKKENTPTIQAFNIK